MVKARVQRIFSKTIEHVTAGRENHHLARTAIQVRPRQQ
jgi:hypothetical protein